MTRPTPEELHDWRKDRHGLDRKRPARDLWIAGLCGCIAGGFSMLVMFAVIDGLPRAGALNGCATLNLNPADCAAYAESR